MVRNYKRKTTRASYPPENLDEAVRVVRSGEQSVRNASLLYHVPRATILDRINRKRVMSVSLGRYPAIPTDVEDNLAACLRIFESNGFELSKEELTNVVARYVKKNNVPTPFKNGKPGKDWMIGFLRRHHFGSKQGIIHSRDPLSVPVKTEIEE